MQIRTSKRVRIIAAIIVFAYIGGLFIFCFLEIAMRSAELFYFQTPLATTYQQLSPAVEQQQILNQVSNFYGI